MADDRDETISYINDKYINFPEIFERLMDTERKLDDLGKDVVLLHKKIQKLEDALHVKTTNKGRK